MDLNSQETIKRLADEHGTEHLLVILGAPDDESAEIAAETVVLGDPTYAGALAEARDDLTVVMLEAPKARRVCIRLQVHALPTFLLMHDGQEVARLSKSAISPPELKTWLDKSLDEMREEVS